MLVFNLDLQRNFESNPIDKTGKKNSVALHFVDVSAYLHIIIV